MRLSRAASEHVLLLPKIHYYTPRERNLAIWGISVHALVRMLEPLGEMRWGDSWEVGLTMGY